MTSQPPSLGIIPDDETARKLALDLSTYKGSGSRYRPEDDPEAIAKVSKFTGITEHVLSILSPSGARGEVLRGLLRMSEAEPIAWECTDERYRFILGIVTTRPETVAAWREGNIKFAALIRSAAAPAEPSARDNEIQSSDGGVESRHADDAKTSTEKNGLLAGLSNSVEAGVAPGPSETIAPPPPDAVQSALAERLSKLAVCLDYRTPHPHTRFVAGLAMSDAERNLIVSSLRSTPGSGVPVPAPNADQVEYLRECEHKPFDPTVVIGSAGGVTGTRELPPEEIDCGEIYRKDCRYPDCGCPVNPELVDPDYNSGPASAISRALSSSDAVAAEPEVGAREMIALACAIEKSDWSNTSIGNKVLIQNAINALRAAPPVRDRETIARCLTDCAQILDVVKTEWTASGAWSEWDQSVRDETTRLRAILSLPSAPVSDEAKGTFAGVVIHRMRALIETAEDGNSWEQEAKAEMQKAVRLLTAPVSERDAVIEECIGEVASYHQELYAPEQDGRNPRDVAIQGTKKEIIKRLRSLSSHKGTAG